MSWISDITDNDGKVIQCAIDCKLGTTCNIPKVKMPITDMLTSIDEGSDGTMATGCVILKCNSFERVETASETAETQGG